MVSVRQMVSSGPAFSVTKSTTRTRTILVFTQPNSFNVTLKLVVVLGKTSGVAEFGFNNIFGVLGVHVKSPKPFACSMRVSMLQISVSVNGSLIIGLSLTSTFTFVMVSIHPLLLDTMSVTVLNPIELYFQVGFCRIELSVAEVS